jgi:hypothetical protein
MMSTSFAIFDTLSLQSERVQLGEDGFAKIAASYGLTEADFAILRENSII